MGSTMKDLPSCEHLHVSKDPQMEGTIGGPLKMCGPRSHEIELTVHTDSCAVVPR